jgi:glutamate synthase domain-containing protein 2
MSVATMRVAYIHAVNKGVLKTMSKMGISTLQSYRGAQIFEAVGISREVIDRYFAGTASRVGGIGLAEIAEEVRLRHAQAFPTRAIAERLELDVGAGARSTCSTPWRSRSCSRRSARTTPRATRNSRGWWTRSRATSARCAA